MEILDLDSLPLEVGSPIVLFQCRESFRHACQDALSVWEKEGAEGKVNKVDTLTEDWENGKPMRTFGACHLRQS